MGILLAFLPFLAFAVVDRLAGPLPGLAAGLLAAGVLVARDGLAGRTPKLLEAATVVLFGVVLAATALGAFAASVIAVRLAVDAGLLLIVLGGLLTGRPFTLQYAREQVPEAYWNEPAFHRINRVITSVWALAFLVLVAVETAMLEMPGFPQHLGVAVIVLALVGAMTFTARYPDRVRGG